MLGTAIQRKAFAYRADHALENFSGAGSGRAADVNDSRALQRQGTIIRRVRDAEAPPISFSRILGLWLTAHCAHRGIDPATLQISVSLNLCNWPQSCHT
jgi:hypothetical protein